jgi:proteasome activator subunit 4
MEAMTGAIGALKCLAQLEPDLIMPAALERAIPSLQGLEEVRLGPGLALTVDRSNSCRHVHARDSG